MMSCRFGDAHQRFAEVTAFEQADEGGWCILKAVGDVLAIADAAIPDGGTDNPQELRVVLGGEFIVDVAARNGSRSRPKSSSRDHA